MKKLLLVDDDRAFLEGLRERLAGAYEVLTTGAPQDVVALARQLRPDLVLCDIEMPVTDGGAVSAALLADAATRDLPVLYLTALATPLQLSARGDHVGGRPAISKRASTGELKARIAAILTVRKTILVLDDDPAAMRALQGLLGNEFTVVASDQPQLAVALAKEHRPDLIVCDIDMPLVDGGAVSAALWGDEATRAIPLLFLTSLATPLQLAGRGGQVGGRPAVSKRATNEEVLAQVRYLVAD